MCAMNTKYALWFDSKRQTHDRVYNSADLRSFFGSIIGNGVFGKSTQELFVSYVSGMNISMSAGKCFINGAIRQFDNVNFTVPNGDSNPRYDSITLRFDLSQRNIVTNYNQGESSTNPVKPAPIKTEEIYELVLCYIYVAADASSISQSVIEDCRGTELCPYVFNLVQDIDTSELFAQYEAQWELLKAACAQDEEAVIAAWDSLNAVKTVNSKAPVDGNVQLALDDILSGSKYPKYTVQWGVITDTSRQPNIVFEKPFKGTPVIFLTGYNSVGSSYYATVFNASATGFTAKYNIVNTVSWIAFGDIVGEGERGV